MLDDKMFTYVDEPEKVKKVVSKIPGLQWEKEQYGSTSSTKGKV